MYYKKALNQVKKGCISCKKKKKWENWLRKEDLTWEKEAVWAGMGGQKARLAPHQEQGRGNSSGKQEEMGSWTRSSTKLTGQKIFGTMGACAQREKALEISGKQKWKTTKPRCNHEANSDGETWRNERRKSTCSSEALKEWPRTTFPFQEGFQLSLILRGTMAMDLWSHTCLFRLFCFSSEPIGLQHRKFNVENNPVKGEK